MTKKSAYEIYESWSAEHKKLYHDKWDKYVEAHHDVDLEKTISLVNVDIDYSLDEHEFQKRNDKEFALTYEKGNDELIQLFSHRKSLKYLFESGFKWISITSKNDLYKKLNKMSEREKNGFKYSQKHRAVRSPESNIVAGEKNDLNLFIEKDELYAYIGNALLGRCNTVEEYFCYVGKLKK